mmetsp:Transcript_26170/g.52186  ORF Transcript_26170/g.52186 Transcript_26170/m.52186 type:complete len:257 (+) Transcript_26170:163-933(+)
MPTGTAATARDLPPRAWTILTDLDGTKQRVKRAEHGWRPSHPVVSCSDADCLRQLQELGGPPPPGGVVCANPSNAPLMMLLLCSWRQHVRETKFEYQAPGAKTWRVTSICTSELTWLGRKIAKGGILGVVAATRNRVDSLEAILKLRDEGAKAISAGFAMLMWLRMDMEGGVASREGVDLFEKVLKKTKETDKARIARLGPNHAAIIASGAEGSKRRSGADVCTGSPWWYAYQAITERRRVDENLRHAILARAHLP